MIIGAHYHGDGIFHHFEKTEENEGKCFQMFIGASNSTRPYQIGLDHVNTFRAMKAKRGLTVAAHGPYLPNVCAAFEPDRIEWSINSIVAYMAAAEILGLEFMVFHPGSFKKATMAHGISAFIESTKRILERTKDMKVKLLWENTAGGGTQVGRVENVAQCVSVINQRDRLGMCIDTVHSFADGHPLDMPEYRAQFWDKYKGLTDWVHFNNPDPKVKLGMHLDRHRVDWLNGRWSADTMVQIAKEWGPDVPLCMEADPTAYDVNFMILDEASLL